MQRRTLDDWKNLVDKQIASGLSVLEFCQQHQLNPKYESNRACRRLTFLRELANEQKI